jgi:hypothetical protein
MKAIPSLIIEVTSLLAISVLIFSPRVAKALRSERQEAGFETIGSVNSTGNPKQSYKALWISPTTT